MIDMGVILLEGGSHIVCMAFEAVIIIGFVLMLAGAMIPEKKPAAVAVNNLD